MFVWGVWGVFVHGMVGLTHASGRVFSIVIVS